MTTNTNLYLDKIQAEHPTACWSLDEDLLSSGPFAYLDSFYTVSSAVIPVQTTTNGGGFMSFTTSTAHGLTANDFVQISGVTPTAYNGRYKVYGVGSSTSFTVNGSTTGNITIAGTATKVYNAYELSAYNSNRHPGYVFANNKLTSKVPLSFGSNDAKFGSFILPSFGMFSSNGKYGQYTLETWVKVKRITDGSKYKLIGLFNEIPTYDDGNGLYYNATSLILKIGNKSESVFIKQINKPMLIHITYSENSASLMVNGEQVIRLVLEESDIDELVAPTQNKDYLIFQSAVFDCPAIYPYKLSVDQAKVHYAYGQAVVVPETLNRQYGSKTISIDFPSARYANNMNYPNNAEWKHGIRDSVNISQYSISNKKFELPNFNFYDTSTSTTKTLDDFFSVYSNTWNFKSLSGWSTVNSNIEFPTLDIFDNKLKGFYTEFSVSGTTTETTEKTIFKIIDKFSKSYFKITMQYNGSDTEIKYRYKDISGTETLLLTQTNADYYNAGSNTTFFLVGIDIDKFGTTFGNNITNFFNNLNNLTMFAYGDNDNTIGSTTPNVNIASIKLLTQNAVNYRSSLINSNGTFYYPSNAYTAGTTEYVANSSIASYQLFIETNNVYNTSYTYSALASTEKYFTIGSSGYWKDFTPLSHFAKTVTKGGVSSQTLDLIQFNVDYDAPMYNTSPVSGIKYFNTSSSSLRTYITFEPVSETYKPDSQFTSTKSAPIDRVVEPDASWATTKYEVVDGTIIYMPSGQDLSSLKIVTHVDFSISDTINDGVQIKSLELTSQALNSDIANPVGTKYANDIIPYTYNTASLTYNYDGYNPFLIEKRTSPYLNLERLSGIRMVGFNKSVANTKRGLRILLNEKQAKYSKINSVQMFVYYDATVDPSQSSAEAFQFSVDTEIFNIVCSDRTLSAYLTGASTTLKTLAVSSTIGGNNENIKFYINGVLTSTPQIPTNEWTMLTLVFTEPLVFDNFIGQFDITGPLSFDNISFYSVKNEDYLNNQISRTWDSVKTPDTGASSYTWTRWDAASWLSLLSMYNPNYQVVDAQNLYNIYTGTNILYSGRNDTNYKLEIMDLSYILYRGYSTYNYTYSVT